MRSSRSISAAWMALLMAIFASVAILALSHPASADTSGTSSDTVISGSGTVDCGVPTDGTTGVAPTDIPSGGSTDVTAPVTDPVVSGSVVTDPVVTDPVSTDSVTDPVSTDSLTDPVSTDSVTDPGTSDSAGTSTDVSTDSPTDLPSVVCEAGGVGAGNAGQPPALAYSGASTTHQLWLAGGLIVGGALITLLGVKVNRRRPKHGH